MKSTRTGISARDERLDDILQMLFFINFGLRAEEAAKNAADRCKGFLTIGGKTFSQIMEDSAYSDEDHDCLMEHLKEKRPRVMAVMKSFNILGLDFMKTNSVTDDVDPEVIASKMEQALAADQAKAMQDSCIWASLEWKWQRMT